MGEMYLVVRVQIVGQRDNYQKKGLNKRKKMIKSIQIKSGYAHEMFGNLKFNFTPGLNILFGENGSGKSTILNILAAYCGVKDKGWSTYLEPSLVWSKRDKFPDKFVKLSPDKCEANVDWDGTPTLKYSANDEIGNDLLSTKESSAMKFVENFSDGQERIGFLNVIGRALTERKPNIIEFDIYKQCNDTWKEAIDSFTDYVKSLPRTGPVTMIMDEPDRSLSITMQMQVWNSLNMISKDTQVIVATHTMFALGIQDANIIEVNKGYIKQCKNHIKTLARQISQNE